MGGFMIKIDHLYKKYGDFLAVDDLNLSISNGTIYGLLGPNGAGKSTTLKMMTGILSPTSGDVYYDEFSIQKNPLEAKRKFAFVPDSPDMFLGMRGSDYLVFIGSLFKMSAHEALSAAEHFAKELNIYDSLNDYILNYSHGMRQKIFLVGALMRNPDVWILDEPLTGLDPESAYKVKHLMRQYADNGHIVILSTHVLDVAEKLVDHLGIIKNGRLIFTGTLQELKEKRNEDDSSLEDLFLELTRK